MTIRRTLFNIGNIARNEITGMLKEPVYYVIAAVAGAIIFFSKDFTLFTFDWGAGDDPSYTRTMVREMGLATAFLAGTFMTLVTASRSIYNEIIHKTALTTLSKPVSRNEFILGKYLGITAGVAPMLLFLGVVLVLAVRFQSAADVAVGLEEKTLWDLAIFRGVYLGFLKTAVLAALAVAVSTQLAFLPNMLIVLTAFVLCHLVNYLNGFLLRVEGPLYYVLQAIYPLFLNLENYNYFFNGEAAYLPAWSLIGLVTLYTGAYSALLLVLAAYSFARRDLY